ncbi:MAG: Zn-dependent alcohol dehydrogenase [Burkholderiales bacterium]|nr:Zn-dependent alcohol dehydrogenase [Burkholderiales bacterium]MDE2393996.1 Zn-dependent alcohol dehydrogenase [Burkholderiales bacterium]MDE2457596.1 Zn-dependent alcohol dehydrogenase [Burkholderiales bacterium]
MKAAVLEAFGQDLVIQDLAIAAPGPNEVLLKTAAVGLCHSDLHFIQGMYKFPLPGVLGHEVSGIVEAVGACVNDLRPGDHVVGALSVFCGTCRQCLGGRFALCQDGDVKQPPGKAERLARGEQKVSQVFNLSGFAEQMLVHRNALVKIREDMPLDRAALLGCAVITGTGAVFRNAQVSPGSTVAVVGCGGVGLAAINGARIAGAARIIAIDTQPAKLELARRFGATDGVLAGDGDVVAKVVEMTQGGVEFAFECIGLPAAVEQCFKMLEPGGTATVVGLFAPGVKLQVEGSGFFLEKKLRGSALGSARIREDIPRLVEHYLQGRLNLDDLISRRIRLEEINEGFAAMTRGEVARSVIVFDAALAAGRNSPAVTN